MEASKKDKIIGITIGVVFILFCLGMIFIVAPHFQKEEFDYNNHECLKWKCEGWRERYAFLSGRTYWDSYWYECTPELFERKCYIEKGISEKALTVRTNSKVEVFPIGVEGEMEIIDDQVVCLEIPFESYDINLEHFEVIEKSLITHPYAECVDFVEKICVYSEEELLTSEEVD